MNSISKSNEDNKLYTLIKLSMLISMLCIIGPIVMPLPISPVPLSLTTLGLYLSIYISGYKKATLITLIYILLGIIGLPIFSGYTCGLPTILGPTGGYIIGYIPMTYLTGLLITKKPAKHTILLILTYIPGLIICYTLGTIWLSYLTKIPYMSSLLIGVLPYLPSDIAKIIISIKIFPKIAKKLDFVKF